MTNLNQNYTFDTFIVGESNRFAFTAAQTVSKEIGVKYNPLCIHGASGLGKTHLLHAIGNEAVSLNKDCVIVYLTSENFTQELIKSIQNGNMSDYREKIRRADILLIDDVQYLAGKPATLEEFHNTFNDLFHDNKQIVFTCDCKPAELKHIGDRLITRFNWGLTVEIASPGMETRLAVLRNKADSLHINMPEANKAITKTERILSIYHMFRFYEEVSMQELRNYFRNVSDKTFSRDIALLKRAGVPIRFSGRRKAFVLVDETGKESLRTPRRAPDFPEGKKEKQFVEKIIRLMTMMDELPYEDCDVWYRETFPEASKRTMQRDFATLKKVQTNDVGYVVYYKRGWENPDDKDDAQPPGHYYYDGVFNP